MIYPPKESAGCDKNCDCPPVTGPTRFIVLTGGPGAGKTAVLEIIQKQLCHHIVILPEAASIIFGGGFWRLPSVSARMAAQRAILHVQQEMESLVRGEANWQVGLCDRGVLDGLAYWPGAEQEFWDAARSSLDAEYERYFGVVHLRTPGDDDGYNYRNPLRTETAMQAREIDERIATIWSHHPRYRAVPSTPDFLQKARMAQEIIKEFMAMKS
jgi:hypothetical protein